MRSSANVSKRIKLYQTVSNCIEVYRNVSKCIVTYRSVLNCIKVYRNVSKRIEVYRNVLNCIEVYRTVSKRIGRDPSLSERIRANGLIPDLLRSPMYFDAIR